MEEWVALSSIVWLLKIRINFFFKSMGGYRVFVITENWDLGVCYKLINPKVKM